MNYNQITYILYILYKKYSRDHDMIHSYHFALRSELIISRSLAPLRETVST